MEYEFHDFFSSSDHFPSTITKNTGQRLRKEWVETQADKSIGVVKLPVRNSKGDRTIVARYEAFSSLKEPNMDNDRYFVS
jgi:hypothetical protein